MIKLRKIEPSDLPFLYQWENDAASWADGANHNPLSQQDLRDYIASTTGDIYRDGQLRLIIERASSPGTTRAIRLWSSEPPRPLCRDRYVERTLFSSLPLRRLHPFFSSLRLDSRVRCHPLAQNEISVNFVMNPKS